MKNYILTIELLPKGAWGNDLSKTLSKKDWDILRHVCYEKSNNTCAICGYSTEELDAHEVWDFDVKTKTQTLKNIVALCSKCHGVKHMRNSQRLGFGENAKRHFLKVNNCSELDFAAHYLEAESLFNEQNKIFRWTIKAELDKFGGKGIEIKQRYIPKIINPYDGIDWTNVKHIKYSDFNTTNLPLKSSLEIETIILQASNYIYGGKLYNNLKKAMYFITHNPNSLPPKIYSVEVNNYDGTITVISDRVNKIQWLSDDNKIIRTKYNNIGKFTTKFCVVNLESSFIQFILTNGGGQLISEQFKLTKGDN